MYVTERDCMHLARTGETLASVRAERPAHDAESAINGPLISVFSTEPDLGVRVAHVAGEIDLSTTHLLGRYLHDELALARRGLVVELSGVSFFAVRGLDVLEEIAQASRLLGTQVRAVVTSKVVARVFELCPLENICIHGFLHDALNHTLESAATG